MLKGRPGPLFVDVYLNDVISVETSTVFYGCISPARLALGLRVRTNFRPVKFSPLIIFRKNWVFNKYGRLGLV